MQAYDDVEEGANVPAALVQRCVVVNREMRAASKKEAKEGSTSRPKSTQDAVIVLVKEQRKINQLLTSILDLYRSVVSYSLPIFRQYFTYS
jgi:hypothetical protein